MLLHSVHFGRPVVFGPTARPLIGRLHETASAPKGGVVICAPWGYEENCAFSALQLLARQLAEAGFEVLRFDYDGCGNSWGDFRDDDRVASWVASCGEALQYMVARVRRPVHSVGLRLGAALAVLASTRHSIDRLVLWDPVVSGRRYLRALRAMSMMGVDAGPDPEDPGSLVTIGHSLSSATVGELERIDLAAVKEARIRSALVLSRPGASDPRRLAAALTGAGVDATLEECVGTETLLDCAAEQAVIPLEILERTVRYITDGATEVATHGLAPLPATATLAAPIPNGWTEEHYEVGPGHLAAVLTLPSQIKRSGVVLMVNNGVARSIGPARAWVEWARQWAGMGVATLRLDLSGLGESPTRPGQRAASQYPAEAIDDFAAAIEALRSRGLAPVVTVGLCSGAFLGIDAAAASLPLAGVVAINSQLFHLPDAAGSAHRARRAAPPTHPWVQRFLENTRVGRRLAREMPAPFWWLLRHSGLQPSPLAGAAAARAKTAMLLIYGEDNLGLVRLRQRDPRGLQRWAQDGTLLVMAGLDHSMFAPQIRRQVESRTRAFVLEGLPAAPECGV